MRLTTTPRRLKPACWGALPISYLMCLLSYVIRCHVHSDAIENRFGWYRQLSGNYFNSVLPFLQSEKTIRIRSLVKSSFRISGVKEIFDGAVTEARNEISFEVDHLIDAMDGIEFIWIFPFLQMMVTQPYSMLLWLLGDLCSKNCPRITMSVAAQWSCIEHPSNLQKMKNVGALSDLQDKEYFIDCVQRWLTASFWLCVFRYMWPCLAAIWKVERARWSSLSTNGQFKSQRIVCERFEKKMVESNDMICQLY